MTLFQHLHFSVRSLSRSPGFTLAFVLTLGLGIGANTAIFSVVRGVLLRPLPHRDGDNLVYLRQSAELAGVDNTLFSVPEILDYRTAASAAPIARAATRIIRELDAEQPIENVLTLAEIRGQTVAPNRLNASLVGAFGVLALVIAAVGIAGVLGFSVSQRTNEIGIRMSLGAEGGTVQRMVLREGAVLLGIGLTIGAMGSLGVSRLVTGLLFDVAPSDPLTLGAVALLLASVSIGASWVPAARASSIEPVEALRFD